MEMGGRSYLRSLDGIEAGTGVIFGGATESEVLICFSLHWVWFFASIINILKFRYLNCDVKISI